MHLRALAERKRLVNIKAQVLPNLAAIALRKALPKQQNKWQVWALLSPTAQAMANRVRQETIGQFMPA